MAEPASQSAARTLDPDEIGRFARLASEWWDPKGKFAALHRIGPARLTFLRDEMVRHFGGTPSKLRPLDGLRRLDVGCGGGLICEPLTRLGAHVTGPDPARILRLAEPLADRIKFSVNVGPSASSNGFFRP